LQATCTVGSPEVIAPEFEQNIIKISRAAHSYSFDIFVYRVAKRDHYKLLDIRRCIEQDQEHFNSQDRSTLVAFLGHVELIVMTVPNAQATKNLPQSVYKRF